MRQVRRLRAWALHAPVGPSDASQFERVVATDLAATAGGDRRPFRGARAFVHHCVADPWRRELALERLAGAEATAGSGAARPHPTISPAADCFWASAWAVALAVALPLPRFLAVAIVTVTTLVAVLGWTELCDGSAYLPQQLALTALLPPAPSRFVLPEPAVVDVLTELAGGDVALVDQAASVLDTVDAREETGRAHARLNAARRALSRGCGSEARAVGLTPVDG
jgi:hypothetical protein